MAMRNLPTTQQYPFDEEQIKSRDAQKLADYLKRLIKQEKAIYEDIARIVNVNAKTYNSNPFGNLDGGYPDSDYGGIPGIDCGGVA